MNVVDLMKNYGDKTVVNEVSFEVPKGKVLSLIGPNGAGKSTVMGMISRLMRIFPNGRARNWRNVWRS